MTAPSIVLFSLQSKLIFAFVAIVLAALLIAGSIFVFVRRGEQEQQELDHVIAASPAVFATFSVMEERRVPPAVLSQFVDEAATAFDVRILLLERQGGRVAADSGADLMGERLALPRDLTVTQSTRFRAYISWEPERGTPGSDLIFVAASTSRFGSFTPDPDQRYHLLLAVPQATIAGAWRGLLPALGVAAAIAVPIAVLLAVIFARYITRPLQQLTVASQRMAEGTFDVDVSIERSDEVGRLAQAFSTMASRVGEAHAQMRSLVASVSHDLKTPLTSILGFAQALRDGGSLGDAEARRMGAVIHDEATRLSARLNDLLYLSELESGQALLQRDEIDLRKLVEGIVARIDGAVAERGVGLSVELADGVVVSADGLKLERALENLLDNARKYTPSAGEIRVRSWIDASFTHVEVANTASDVDPDELPRLFGRFYRRNRARSEADGSGLGLPIARDLVELHGGTLEASLRDGDIVFSVNLPLRPGDEPKGT